MANLRPPRPGIAHADRRELRLVREWLEEADGTALGAVIDAIRSADPEGEGARMDVLARRAGVRRSPPWRAFRRGDALVFHAHGAALELEVQDRGRGVRVTSGVVAPVDEAEVIDLETAIDEVAPAVLSWLRAHGERPAFVARLASLFAPRPRGATWPSSPS